MAVGPIGTVTAQQSDAADPGQIEKRIRPPAQPRGQVAPIPVPEPPPPADALAALKFVLTGVEFGGASVYPPAKLSFAYEPYLGKEITAEEIEKILSAITAKYRNDGYVLSRATAPAQTVRFGILRIEIVEGFVERVAFTGDKPGGERLLQGMAGRIVASRPTRLAVLERYLLLMGDASGLRVYPTLQALDEQHGAYQLNIRLEHDAINAFASLDNRGTTELGPLQALAGLDLNSTMGLLERTRLAVFTVPDDPRELRYGQIYHEQPLDPEGTRVWLLASRSLIDTHEVGTGLEDQRAGSRVSFGVSHPFVRGRAFNLTGSITFDAINSEKTSGTGIYDDRLRVVRIGAAVDFRDDFSGSNRIYLEASTGLDVLNASEPGASSASRPGAGGNFFKVKLEAARRQALLDDVYLLLAASAQESDNRLLAAEEFTVGGRRFGRAYDPSIVSGSDGAAGALELQYDVPYRSEIVRHLQLFAYYDIGAVWSPGIDRESAASAGGGLRLVLPFDIRADLELGWPLTRAAEAGERHDKDPRLFFSVSSRF